MLADTILRLLGNNPVAYPNLKDKWIVISVDLTFYAVPIFLVILFISPFLFLWIKKKHFSLKNIIISLFAGVVLVVLALGGIWLILWYLQGLVFVDIHS